MSGSKTPRSGKARARVRPGASRRGVAGQPSDTTTAPDGAVVAVQAADARSEPLPVQAPSPAPPTGPDAPDLAGPMPADLAAVSLTMLELYRQGVEANLAFWTTLLEQPASRDDEAA